MTAAVETEVSNFCFFSFVFDVSFRGILPADKVIPCDYQEAHLGSL
jgi:hypothetical protein